MMGKWNSTDEAMFQASQRASGVKIITIDKEKGIWATDREIDSGAAHQMYSVIYDIVVKQGWDIAITPMDSGKYMLERKHGKNARKMKGYHSNYMGFHYWRIIEKPKVDKL